MPDTGCGTPFRPVAAEFNHWGKVEPSSKNLGYAAMSAISTHACFGSVDAWRQSEVHVHGKDYYWPVHFSARPGPARLSNLLDPARYIDFGADPHPPPPLARFTYFTPAGFPQPFPHGHGPYSGPASMTRF